MKKKKVKTQAAQVYFPKHVYFEIKLAAKDEDKAAAAWIRDVVMKELKKKKKKMKKFSDMPSFSFPDVDPFTSEEIDKIVYKL